MSFEWQTEEESDEQWQEAAPATEPALPSRRRAWLAIVITLLLAATAAVYLYQQGQERIEESAAQLEEDVLSSHQLGLTAAESGDEEIFTAILSGREPAWTEAQKERLRAGIVYGQTARVLGLMPAGESAAGPEISFSPDLREATVTTAYPYLRPGTDVTETVTLSQTVVYRRGTNRWLLAPSKSDTFWGNWRTRERDFVTLTYPVRDEEVALKLARDLDEKVAELCAQLRCESDLKVRLRLERAPESLLPLLNPEMVLTGRETVVLPTPTLIGIPTDDESYEALFHGYARHLLSALLVALDDWRCCDYVLYRQALLYQQLAALDVAPEPVTAVDYLALPDRLPDLDQLRLWSRQDDPAREAGEIPVGVYIFLEFLLAERDGNLFSLQQDLEGTLRAWIVRGRGAAEPEREAAWRDFVRRQLRSAQAEIEMPPGLTLPGQDLLLVCYPQNWAREPDPPMATLYRYQFDSGEWTEEIDADARFVMLAVLPADDGFFLSTQQMTPEANGFNITTYLQRQGEEPILVAGGEEVPDAMIPWPWVEPEGERMLAWTFAQGTPQVEPVFALVEPDSCSREGCSVEGIAGFPMWSPDGQQLIVMSFDGNDKIARKGAAEESWQEVGRGIFAFWVDNEVYGFINHEARGEEPGLWLGTVGVDEPRLWLTAKMLDDVRPANDSPLSSVITLVLRHPLKADRLLVVATSRRGESELFEVGRGSDEQTWVESAPAIRYLATFPGRITGLPLLRGMVEPDRPWLLLSGEEAAGFWLYDLAVEALLLSSPTNLGYFEQTYDWSGDGNWLAYPAEGAIAIVAPGFTVAGHPYRQLLFHRYGYCAATGWVNGD